MKNKPDNIPKLDLTKPQFFGNIHHIPDVSNKMLNVGIFYEAASWQDIDYFTFLLIQRIISEKPESVAEQEML